MSDNDKSMESLGAGLAGMFGGGKSKAKELPFTLSKEGISGEPHNASERLMHFMVLIMKLGEKQASEDVSTILYDFKKVMEAYKKLYGVEMSEDDPRAVLQLQISPVKGKVPADTLLTILEIASRMAE